MKYGVTKKYALCFLIEVRVRARVRVRVRVRVRARTLLPHRGQG